MFIVRVAARVHAGSVAPFLEALEDTPRHVRDRFPGCRWFGVHVDANDPLRVVVCEEWDTRDSYEELRTSTYTEQVMSVLEPLMDGPPDTAYYQSEPVDPWWP